MAINDDPLTGSQASPQSADEGSSMVMKSALPAALDWAFQSQAQEAAHDGSYLWPVEPQALALLYRANSEHSRAIQIKAESSFGGGLIGPGAARLEALCERGAADLFVSIGIDLECFGNGFLQLVTAGSGNARRVVALRRLPAITMRRKPSGFIQSFVDASGKRQLIHFAADEIIHLRVACPFGRHYSLPSWIGAEGMLELAKAATRYNAAFFKNNAIPEHAVIFKGAAPGAAQKEAIKEFFRNEYQGFDNAHRTLLLHCSDDASIDIKKVTADVKDADFLKLMDAARDRIPVAHGVPPRMLGIISAGSLGGGGEVTGQLFTFEHLTLKPKRRSMLDQLRPLLALLGLRAGVDGEPLDDDQLAFKALDLTPPEDRSDKLPALVEAGILSDAEARVLLPWVLGETSASPRAANTSASAAAAPTATPLIQKSAGHGPVPSGQASLADLAALLASL